MLVSTEMLLPYCSGPLPAACKKPAACWFGNCIQGLAPKSGCRQALSKVFLRDATSQEFTVNLRGGRSALYVFINHHLQFCPLQHIYPKAYRTWRVFYCFNLATSQDGADLRMFAWMGFFFMSKHPHEDQWVIWYSASPWAGEQALFVVRLQKC